MPQSTKSSEGSRLKLIESTIELMGSHGFESMGISLILEKAGVTKSNFYYHFKSKEELCLAALDQMENQFFEEFLIPVLKDESKSPKQRLIAFYECTKKKMEENCCNQGCPFVNLATETSDFHPMFREKIDSFYKRYVKLLAELIEEGIQKGEFRDDISSTDTANLFLANMNGTIVLAKVQKNADVIENNFVSTLKLISKI